MPATTGCASINTTPNHWRTGPIDSPAPKAHPDFSQDVIDDLYRYRPRHLAIAYLLALPLGVLGAHRFYCGKPFTGLLMLFTAGGGMLWWIWDLLRLRRLVDNSNAEEKQRLEAGLPPLGLNFLPPRAELRLNEPPAWAARRAGRGRIVGSAILLALLGFVLGLISSRTGSYETVMVLLLFIGATLLAARWRGMAQVPVLRALARWVHKLRLFYHNVDPGPVLRLATRPLLGVFLAPWRPKARAEVRLYLEFGVAIAIAFAALDIAQVLGSGGFWEGLAIIVAEFVQTFVMIYLFVAPAGALINTQLLLAQRDHIVWLLSAITVYAVYLGVQLA